MTSEYRIAIADSPEELTSLLSEFLFLGWEPQGGLVVFNASISRDGAHFGQMRFAQAVVLRRQLTCVLDREQAKTAAKDFLNAGQARPNWRD